MHDGGWLLDTYLHETRAQGERFEKCPSVVKDLEGNRKQSENEKGNRKGKTKQDDVDLRGLERDAD